MKIYSLILTCALAALLLGSTGAVTVKACDGECTKEKKSGGAEGT